jgi:LysR family transcriptional regulator, chromosome initiation inhibitor
MSLLSPQLLAFIKVAKNKTVHGAAAEMFLTQTAVTQRIRILEGSLKTTLFIRTRKGMILTQEGESLLRYCQAAIELEGEALASIQESGKESEIEITISSPTSIMRSRVIPNCLPIIKKFPNLLINFNANDDENLHLDLRSGNSDFSIIQKEQLSQEMKFKELAPEQYVLVCGSSWKNRKLSEIIKNERIIDFNSPDQITINYLKKYRLYNNAKSNRYFANRTDNLALLVSEGVGYTTLPKEFAMRYIKKNQLMVLNDNNIYNISPVLAWFDRPVPPAYFSEIINLIN